MANEMVCLISSEFLLFVVLLVAIVKSLLKIFFLQNLLFYYETETAHGKEKKPNIKGLIFLEGCYCERLVSSSCLTNSTPGTKLTKEEKLQVGIFDNFIFYFWNFIKVDESENCDGILWIIFFLWIFHVCWRYFWFVKIKYIFLGNNVSLFPFSTMPK